MKESSDLKAGASTGRDVYVELRLSTTRGSKVAITVGVSDQASDEMVEETIKRAQVGLEVLCEEFNRLDDLRAQQRENEDGLVP